MRCERRTERGNPQQSKISQVNDFSDRELAECFALAFLAHCDYRNSCPLEILVIGMPRRSSVFNWEWRFTAKHFRKISRLPDFQRPCADTWGYGFGFSLVDGKFLC
jgi:hypothetical protein